MPDLIERDAAIARIDCCLGNSLGGRTEFDSGLMQARKFVMDTPTVNRWISVGDALPENNEIVWVCLYWGRDAYVRKGYIKNESWYTTDGCQMCIIPKFWMREYIPEPPKEC